MHRGGSHCYRRLFETQLDGRGKMEQKNGCWIDIVINKSKKTWGQTSPDIDPHRLESTKDLTFNFSAPGIPPLLLYIVLPFAIIFWSIHHLIFYNEKYFPVADYRNFFDWKFFCTNYRHWYHYSGRQFSTRTKSQ